MNYKVLYRKYRPADFENIVGQDYIIKTLKNSIINKNISHAYIFSGPRGTGKTSTAKVFAKAINCLNSKDGSPCGKCEFCLNFIENPDIIEIDAASNNGVDEIRNLIENIKLTPSNSKYKVYIIDEVHMLTTSAFNALLLTLEEPPAHAIFILATTNIENVPITILSRCQRFDFQKITSEQIVSALKKICEYESIEASDDALFEIAYLADGGMRDALSLLDQLAKNDETITLDLVEKQIKTISKKSINDLLNIIENNNTEEFLSYIENFKNRGVDYKTLVKKIIDGLSNKAKDTRVKNIKSRLSFSDYKKLIIDLSDSLIKVNINVDSYIILEMIIMEYFKIEGKENNNSIINNKNSEDIKIQTNNYDVDLKKVRINNCFVNAKKENLEICKSIISKLSNSIDVDGKVKSILLDSTVVAASDKYMILTGINDRITDSANDILDVFEKEIKTIEKVDYKMIFLTQEEWNNEKKKYINNIRNGYKYEYIEEHQEEKIDNNISDVFDINKVEII